MENNIHTFLWYMPVVDGEVFGINVWGGVKWKL